MKTLRMLAGALCGIWLVAAPALAAQLTVHVNNVSPRGGTVSLALFTNANYHDDDHPTVSRDVPAQSPQTTIAITGLQPGTYAVKMMQDINGNGKFDTDLIGLPEEPYGFSNNAKPFLSEPDFSRTKFRVGSGTTTISIKLSDTDTIAPSGSGASTGRAQVKDAGDSR